MKTLTKSILIVFVLFSVLCSLYSISYADIPHLINYQGKLTDKDSKPVSDGAYSVTFRIYDAESAGNLLWSETQSVTVSKGIFSVLLGAATTLDLSFDKPYWLEIKVGNEVMSPRQRMASVGYAYYAEAAEYGVPKGAIIMWSGKISDIPSGWALCDGSNGTPDLRDRFVVCARQDDADTSKTNISGSLTKTGGTVTHIHNTPAHTHNLRLSGQANCLGGAEIWANLDGGTLQIKSSGTPAGGAVQTDTVSGGSGTTSSESNLSPYYALAFIMKL